LHTHEYDNLNTLIHANGKESVIHPTLLANASWRNANIRR